MEPLEFRDLTQQPEVTQLAQVGPEPGLQASREGASSHYVHWPEAAPCVLAMLPGAGKTPCLKQQT